ncbi:hypothetical protein F5Y13DRAFT_176329 [Hypoxylon sp. FL1857]|nr:hypothetical protein F5Y13DRAFT_176329 [Hypoxylon sp. FL1857]
MDQHKQIRVNTITATAGPQSRLSSSVWNTEYNSKHNLVISSLFPSLQPISKYLLMLLLKNASSTNPPMTSRTSNLVDLNGGWHSDSDSESSLESLRHYFYRKWGLGPSNQKGKNRAEEKSATRQEDQVESRVSISQPNNVRSPARQTEELNALHEGRDPGRALTTTERDMLTAGTGAAPLDRRCGTSVKDIGKPAAQEGLIRADKALLSTEAAPGLAGRNRSKVAPVKSPTVNHIPPRRAAVKKRKAIRSTNILTRWKRLLNPQI